MSRPQTLLQMAGARGAPHPLSASAVVFIDCQLEYVTGRVPLPGVASALAEGAKLLAAARDAGRPIIHVVHRGAKGGLFDPEGPRYAVAPELAPREGEAVVEKTLPNAFAKTDLADRLAALGVKSMIVAGFMTHMCVSSTVRAALDLGLGCTVVAGACATRDLPTPDGGVIAAADLHRAELAALADRFAVVVGETSALDG